MIIETIRFGVAGSQEEQQATLRRIFDLLVSEPHVTAILESGFVEYEEATH